jgi:hypothetical protein
MKKLGGTMSLPRPGYDTMLCCGFDMAQSHLVRVDEGAALLLWFWRCALCRGAFESQAPNFANGYNVHRQSRTSQA